MGLLWGFVGCSRFRESESEGAGHSAEMSRLSVQLRWIIGSAVAQLSTAYGVILLLDVPIVDTGQAYNMYVRFKQDPNAAIAESPMAEVSFYVKCNSGHFRSSKQLADGTDRIATYDFR